MKAIGRCGLSVAVLAVLSGCGGGNEVELGTVSGIVTLDGAPLRGVFVTFQPQGYPPSMGVTDKDGKFELTYAGEQGAVVGTHEVYLDELLADEVEEYQTDIGGRPSKVPEKFMEPFQTVEVNSGHNDVFLELSSGEG